LHIVTTVAAVWIPLATDLTLANVADNEVAPALIWELPEEVRFVLGDLHYNAPNVYQVCTQRGQILVTSQYGKYPHKVPGVEVRRIFHKLHSLAIENFNEHFSTLSVFLTATVRSLPGAWPIHSDLPWGRFLSINWPSCTALRMALP